ncbi:MAG TPA: MBL fold metallo-hydrolase, partial [Pseudonocardiaceae bacterium]|nr:MBL fold metallo-hydrolase [Pseudonocardiaceae bacterium]
TERFLAAVDGATDGRPIRLAINTHLHGDHTYGNALLPDSTAIVAHERTREGLLADFILAATPPIWSPSPDWGITSVRPPTVVLRDEATLFAGQRRIELRHPGYAAHTQGDVVAWLPEEGVLFSGDLLFHQVTPLVFMGSVDGALRSLDWLAGFGANTVVPGHGPLIDKAGLPDVLAAHERYYRFITDTARRGMADDLAPLAVATGLDLGEFASWPDAERLVLNLHRAYADAAGTTMDLLAAFTDAITWHGGPLHCAV